MSTGRRLLQAVRSPAFWALLVIVTTGAALRFWNAGSWPPGLEYDEGLQGMDAVGVLAGHFAVYFREAYREPMYVYLAAPAIAWLGRTELAIRLPAMIAGTITPLLAFLLVRDLFRSHGEAKAIRIGLLSAAFCAVSLWPLIMSRTAIPGTVLPPAATLMLWLFWRAVRPALPGAGTQGTRVSLLKFALFGLALGACVYTYLPSRLLPFVVAGFLAAQAALNWPQAAIRHTWKGMLLAIIASIAVFLPLGLYYLNDPAGLLGRASHVSVFRPDVPEGSPGAAIIRTTQEEFLSFGIAGDTNWYHNLPGRPILDPVAAVCAAIGLALLLSGIRRPGDLLVLVWAAVMLVPGILSDDNNPNTARMVGLIPVLFIFPARGLEAVLALILRWRAGAAVATAAAVLVLAFSTYSTAAAFSYWAQQPEAFAARSGESVDAVRAMNAHGNEPGAFFLLPISNRWPVERQYQQRSIQFLYHAAAPYNFLRIDDEETPEALTKLCGGCRKLYIFVWNKGPHVDADPKGLATFLAGEAGLEIPAEGRSGSELRIYTLPENVSFEQPALAAAADSLGGRLMVTGYAARQSWSGRDVAVSVRLRLLKRGADNERLSYRLIDHTGRTVSQVDRLLLSNGHQGTSGWESDTETVDRMLVPVPPGTPPGTFRLELVAYGGGPEAITRLGDVRVERPRVPYPLDYLELDSTSTFELPTARLLGMTIDADSVASGGVLPVTLYWQATAPTPRTMPFYPPRVELQLSPLDGQRGPDGDPMGWSIGPPGGTTYDYILWDTGDLVADRRPVQLRYDAPPGQYRLVVLVDNTPAMAMPITVTPK